MSEDARIEVLKVKLADSKCIPKAEVDALADDLEFAQSINGDPDPTRQMMKRTLISGVRREMLAHERHAQASRDFSEALKEGLDKHTKNCPLSAKKSQTESNIRLGKFFEAKGDAAKIVAIVVTLVGLLAGYATWQNSKTREMLKTSMQTAVQEALQKN